MVSAEINRFPNFMRASEFTKSWIRDEIKVTQILTEWRILFRLIEVTCWVIC